MYRISPQPNSLRWLTILLLFVSLLFVAGCTRDRAAETAENGDVQTQESGETSEGGSSADPEVTFVEPTATPVPSPTPTPEPETITYRVLPGDTVSTVAEKFGTTSENVRQINLLGTDALQVGQVLRVPYIPGVTTEEGIPTATPSPLEYSVQEGDTLLSIAIEFGVTTNDIIAANTIRNQDDLVVGQVLTIPGVAAIDTAVAVSGGSTSLTSQELIQHTVAAGETLSTIAEQYEVSTQAVSEANSITDPNSVRVGQVLTIPIVREIPQTEHVVAAGETLFSIAIRYDVSPDVIVEVNSLADPDNLSAGQVLIIPGVAADAGTAGTEETPAVTSEPVVHTVISGESLGSIAVRYGVTVDAIIAENSLTDPDLLRAGDELTIPGVTQTEAAIANQTTHTVAAGETLYAIARQYGVSVDALVDANNLANPNRLTVGQELTIP